MFGVFFIIGGLLVTKFFITQYQSHAAVGGAGNVKVTLTNELGAVVTGGTIAVVCDGSTVSFADNGERDLDNTVGTIEVTPTFPDLATTGCSTNGEAVHITFSSTDGTLVTKTVDSTLTLTGVNTIAIPSIQYPLAVTLKDAFGANITPDLITYNGDAPTATSGATSYWASTTGSGELVVRKTGYVNASATNPGLAAVGVGTTGKTSVALDNASAVSSAVSAGSTVTAQGLSPTVKLIAMDTSGATLDLSSVVVEKSIDGGTTFSSFTPLNISSNIGYDSVDPASGAVMYRMSFTGYQLLTSESITPSDTLQTIVTMTLAGVGRSPGSSSTSQSAVGGLTFTQGASGSGMTGLNLVIVTPEEATTELNDTLTEDQKSKLANPLPDQPTLVVPDPTILSSTSIQWNLPTDIPARFLPATAVLSAVEGEGESKHLIYIGETVITDQTTNPTIIEDQLLPGTLYDNRVIRINGYPKNFLLPEATTFNDTSTSLQMDAQSTPEHPRILLSNTHYPPNTEVAIVVEKEGKERQYLQADSTLNSSIEWRPWYKWGFAKCAEWEGAACVKLDPEYRVLSFAEIVPAGTYTLSRITRTTPQGNPSEPYSPLIVEYVPNIEDTP